MTWLIQSSTFPLTYSSRYDLEPSAAPKCLLPCVVMLIAIPSNTSLVASSFSGFVISQHFFALISQSRSRLDQCISNSLIIHEENTKEINTETEFGYVMKHLHKINPTFISIFSLNTDLFEMLDQTLGRVFHQDIQTPRSC